MTVPKILMCQPVYFGVEYEINDWMDVRNQPDKKLAFRQWQRLVNVYRDLGAFVRMIAPQPDLPDMVFTANAGLIYKGKFISSNFRHRERKGESRHFRQYFLEKGFPIIHLPANAYFEGHGDALLVSEEKLLLGYGYRTSASAIPYLKRYMKDCEIIPLKLKHSGTGKLFYHLDTVLAYLAPTNTFLMYADALSGEAVEAVFGLGKVILVTYEEAEAMNCNVTLIDRTLIVPAGFSKRLEEMLTDDGYRVIRVDTSEFLKAGGSVMCLSFVY